MVLMFSQVASQATRTLADSTYIDLLERTNQQLGLWSNPYGIMVAFLSALLTTLALVTAYVLYRQGRDYRDRMEQFLAGYQKVFDALVERTNEQTQTAIDGLQKQLETAKGEQKEALQKAIEQLQHRFLVPEPIAAPTGLHSIGRIARVGRKTLGDLLGEEIDKRKKFGE